MDASINLNSASSWLSYQPDQLLIAFKDLLYQEGKLEVASTELLPLKKVVDKSQNLAIPLFRILTQLRLNSLGKIDALSIDHEFDGIDPSCAFDVSIKVYCLAKLQLESFQPVQLPLNPSELNDKIYALYFAFLDESLQPPIDQRLFAIEHVSLLEGKKLTYRLPFFKWMSEHCNEELQEEIKNTLDHKRYGFFWNLIESLERKTLTLIKLQALIQAVNKFPSHITENQFVSLFQVVAKSHEGWEHLIPLLVHVSCFINERSWEQAEIHMINRLIGQKRLTMKTPLAFDLNSSNYLHQVQLLECQCYLPERLCTQEMANWLVSKTKDFHALYPAKFLKHFVQIASDTSLSYDTFEKLFTLFKGVLHSDSNKYHISLEQMLKSLGTDLFLDQIAAFKNLNHLPYKPIAICLFNRFSEEEKKNGLLIQIIEFLNQLPKSFQQELKSIFNDCFIHPRLFIEMGESFSSLDKVYQSDKKVLDKITSLFMCANDNIFRYAMFEMLSFFSGNDIFYSCSVIKTLKFDDQTDENIRALITLFKEVSPLAFYNVYLKSVNDRLSFQKLDPLCQFYKTANAWQNNLCSRLLRDFSINQLENHLLEAIFLFCQLDQSECDQLLEFIPTAHQLKAIDKIYVNRQKKDLLQYLLSYDLVLREEVFNSLRRQLLSGHIGCNQIFRNRHALTLTEKDPLFSDVIQFKADSDAGYLRMLNESEGALFRPKFIPKMIEGHLVSLCPEALQKKVTESLLHLDDSFNSELFVKELEALLNQFSFDINEFHHSYLKRSLYLPIDCAQRRDAFRICKHFQILWSEPLKRQETVTTFFNFLSRLRSSPHGFHTELHFNSLLLNSTPANVEYVLQHYLHFIFVSVDFLNEISEDPSRTNIPAALKNLLFRHIGLHHEPIYPVVEYQQYNFLYKTTQEILAIYEKYVSVEEIVDEIQKFTTRPLSEVLQLIKESPFFEVYNFNDMKDQKRLIEKHKKFNQRALCFLSDEALNEFSDKKNIDLRQRALYTLPSKFFDMIHIESLYLGGNYMTELSQEIGRLKNLKTLQLIGTPLQKLPKELLQLPALKILMVSRMHLNKESIEILDQLKEKGVNVIS